VTSNLWRKVYTWATNNGYAFANVGSAKTDNHPVQTVKLVRLPGLVQRAQSTGWIHTVLHKREWHGLHEQRRQFLHRGLPVGRQRLSPTDGSGVGEGGARRGGQPALSVGRRQHHPACAGELLCRSHQLHVRHQSDTGWHPSAGGTDPRTMAVGSFAPNGYGIYDMAGNVSEWCWDWYDSVYYSTPPANDPDPKGPPTGTSRVLLGGAWDNFAQYGRCASRGNDGISPDAHSDSAGFRCARGF